MTTPRKRELVIVLVLLSALSIIFSQPSEETTKVIANKLDVTSDWRTTLKWTRVPETRILAHVPGWTIFDRLYALNGTVYVVTDNPEKAPNATMMYSKGIFVMPGREEEEKRIPTDNEMRIISTQQATVLFGHSASIIDGVTVSTMYFFF